MKMSGKNKQKILIITPYFYPEDFPINNFTKELSLHNYEIHILTGLPNYRKFGFYENYSFLGPFKEKYEKINVLRVPVIPRFSNHFISIFFFYASFFVSSLFFILYFALISRNKFLHVLSFCGSPVYVGFLGTLFAKIANCKSSQWIQDIWPEALITSLNIKNNNFILKCIDYLQVKMWLSSDILISQSELLKDYLNDFFKGKKKIVCVRNPVRERIELISNLNIEKMNNHKIITYFGNIGHTQNIELFINLIKNEKNIIFNICGMGSMLDEFKKKYKNYPNIIFYGWVDKDKMKTIADTTDFFYLSLKNLGRQNYIFPSKFQTYLNYSKPIIFIGDKKFCSLIEENSLGYSLDINKIQNSDYVISKIMNLSISDKEQFVKNTSRYFNDKFDLKKIINTFRNEVLNG